MEKGRIVVLPWFLDVVVKKKKNQNLVDLNHSFVFKSMFILVFDLLPIWELFFFYRLRD